MKTPRKSIELEQNVLHFGVVIEDQLKMNRRLGLPRRDGHDDVPFKRRPARGSGLDELQEILEEIHVT